jgi:hypothetical protein
VQKTDRGTAVFYEIDGTVVWRVLQFIVFIKQLSDLHAAYRWAGKGASIAFSPGTLPSQIAEPAIRAATALYDERLGSKTGPFARMGTVIFDDARGGTESDMMVVHRASPVTLNVAELVGTPGKLEGAFLPRILDFAALRTLLAQAPATEVLATHREVGALFALLSMGVRLIARHPPNMMTVVARGFILLTREQFMSECGLGAWRAELPDFLAEWAQMDDAQLVADSLVAMRGDSWPLRAGSVIRIDENAVCLDLATATTRLEAALQHSAIQGSVANLRADHFEDQTQAAIDRTSWQPTETLRKVRRQTLRRGGRAVTDIDALGERDGVLLVISCKSFIYSDKYDIGEFRTVRNVAQMVAEAARHWATFVDELVHTPQGDNFNFGAFRQIIGVVCTPVVPYVVLGVATAEVSPGLQRTVSIRELEDWLRGDP